MKKIFLLCFVLASFVFGEKNEVILTVGDLKEDYKIIQVIFSLKKGKTEDDILEVLESLERKAEEVGGNAVVGLRIQIFSFSKDDYGDEVMILAYGTAVKRREK